MTKPPKNTVDDKDKYSDYLLEVTSKYHEQLEYLTARKERLKRLSIAFAIVFLVLSFSAVFIFNSFRLSYSNSLLGPVVATYGGMLFALYYVQYSSIQSKINQTLTRLRLEEKLDGTSKSTETTSENEEYFSKLVQINIENLSAYYEQVKNHANKSFIASLVMSIIGFAIIVTGLSIGFNSQGSQTLLIFVSTASGIIVEAIAALFFYLYTQTVHQMKGYHDGLLYVQNILLSLKLIEGIEGVDADLKAQSINKVVEYLLAQGPTHK